LFRLSAPSKFRRSLDLPVERVNWHDAKEFCRKLSEIEKATYRLPTEAEWEYCCRAGTTTYYYWGDKFDRRYAWRNPDPGDPHDPEPDPHPREHGTQEVGGKLPNAWGLYDMSGNVWEMVEDRFSESYDIRAEQIDPKGASADSPCLAHVQPGSRVARGGCWWSSAYECTSWIRAGCDPTLRIYHLGFRVVKEVR
jgi:formylglycine-generating enzyme required for sulfatase activity